MTAALNDQLCIGNGKSWRTNGILCAFAACSSSGESLRHLGHCKSSNTISATGEPLGGRSSAGSWARASEPSNKGKVRESSKGFFIFSLDGEQPVFMVTEVAGYVRH